MYNGIFRNSNHLHGRRLANDTRSMRLFGIEEELLLVDEATGAALPAAPALLDRHGARYHGGWLPELTAEMQQEMIEAVTEPQSSINGLQDAVIQGRLAADLAAAEAGARAVALATSPLPVSPHATGERRYQTMMERYGVTARESLACGMHVHVSIESPAEGVAVLDRMRTWLPLLRALSANSPYCRGIDTGHASYRSIAWNQWPCAGPLDVLESSGAYSSFERQMLQTGALMDEGMLYFDARLSRRHPTVEIRVSDVCLSVSDAAAIGGLVRALVDTCAGQWRDGVAPLSMPTAVIRLASWRAALGGVSDELVSPATGRPVRAGEAIDALLEYVDPALSHSGDSTFVREGVAAILNRGTGADWQRASYKETGSLAGMIHAAVDATHEHAKLP